LGLFQNLHKLGPNNGFKTDFWLVQGSIPYMDLGVGLRPILEKLEPMKNDTRVMHWISKMKDPVIPTKVHGKSMGQEWNTFKQHEE